MPRSTVLENLYIQNKIDDLVTNRIEPLEVASTPTSLGTNTGGLELDSSTQVLELNHLNEPNFNSNSTTQAPTQSSTKTYITNYVNDRLAFSQNRTLRFLASDTDLTGLRSGFYSVVKSAGVTTDNLPPPKNPAANTRYIVEIFVGNTHWLFRACEVGALNSFSNDCWLKMKGDFDANDSGWVRSGGYDNSISQLNADTVKLALDELSPNAVLTSTYGERAYIDPDLNLVLAEQIRFEGCGINSGGTTGWGRRFNGMPLTNTTGMMSDKGMVITEAEFTCDNNVAGRAVQFYHYNVNGGDIKQAGEFKIDQEDNQFGFLANAKIIIPGRRRFASFFRASSGNFARPQLRIGYRKILEVL